MAITVANQVVVVNDLYSLEKFIFNGGDFNTWSAATMLMVASLQDEAINNTDADAEAWLTANRSFFKNVSGADRVIHYNGIAYTIASATSYCCSAGEAAFFIQEAANFGWTFNAVDLTEYLSTGVVQTFFE